MIELNEVKKTFQRNGVLTPVLESINLRVESGEYLAISGPSGTGKSTLMNILGCLDRPSSGRYSLDGQEVTALSDTELSRLRSEKIGFVFQMYHLVPRLTVVENVLLPLLYTHQYPPHARRNAEELLDIVGLSNRVRYRPPELSGGQQQRVAIARALINDPSLLLADEPTGNLDEKAGRDIMDLFEQVHDAGRTVIVVTHDAEIAGRANRSIALKNGRVESTGHVT